MQGLNSELIYEGMGQEVLRHEAMWMGRADDPGVGSSND